MRRRVPVILATALAATALVTVGAQAAQAAPRPQTASCYDWSYTYAIDSSHIHVGANWECGGTAPQAWLVLQRLLPGGNWQYVTDSYSPYPRNAIDYTCVNSTPNTYQVGPIFAPDGSYSFVTFTDNCG
jgi:hypothetical protein